MTYGEFRSKSTLLQAVGLLEGGFGGSIRIAGVEAAKLDGHGRTAVRLDRLGFVYQFHHLLSDFTAVENVVLPQLVRGVRLLNVRDWVVTAQSALSERARLSSTWRLWTSTAIPALPVAPVRRSPCPSALPVYQPFQRC